MNRGKASTPARMGSGLGGRGGPGERAGGVCAGRRRIDGERGDPAPENAEPRGSASTAMVGGVGARFDRRHPELERGAGTRVVDAAGADRPDADGTGELQETWIAGRGDRGRGGCASSEPHVNDRAVDRQRQALDDDRSARRTVVRYEDRAGHGVRADNRGAGPQEERDVTSATAAVVAIAAADPRGSSGPIESPSTSSRLARRNPVTPGGGPALVGVAGLLLLVLLVIALAYAAMMSVLMV